MEGGKEHNEGWDEGQRWTEGTWTFTSFWLFLTRKHANS